MPDVKIPTTTLFEKVASAGKNPENQIIVLQGSSGSSKTWSIIQWLVYRALTENGLEIRCFRHDGTTHENTTVRDFYNIMRNHYQLWNPKSYNRTKKIYTFDNGSYIQFSAANDIDELHGMRQDIAWLNEVMEIKEKAWKQIETRTRKQTFMDYNPSVTSHWVFNSILTRQTGVKYIHSTYKDNEFLSKAEVEAIELREPTEEHKSMGTADEWRWRVYGLGERAGREGRIFENYRIEENWPDVNLCIKHGFGLDFGFNVDPTALIECGIYNDELYVREWVYEKNLIITKSESRPNTPSLEGRMRTAGMDGHRKILADSSRPDNISALKQAGYNVVACRKPRDGIQSGIQLMKNYTIVIQRRSQNILEEIENYAWDENGDEPIDSYNHAMDAIRYWALHTLMPAQREPIKFDDLPTEAESGSVLELA